MNKKREIYQKKRTKSAEEIQNENEFLKNEFDGGVWRRVFWRQSDSF